MTATFCIQDKILTPAPRNTYKINLKYMLGDCDWYKDVVYQVDNVLNLEFLYEAYRLLETLGTTYEKCKEPLLSLFDEYYRKNCPELIEWMGKCNTLIEGYNQAFECIMEGVPYSAIYDRAYSVDQITITYFDADSNEHQVIVLHER